MKKLFLLFAVLFCFNALSQQQELKFKSYSLAEFFEMLEAESTDTFTLKNANIVLDTVTDREHMKRRIDLVTSESMRKDSLHIYKTIVLENVFSKGALNQDKYILALDKLVFHKPLVVTNSSLEFDNNRFLDMVRVRYSRDFDKVVTSNFGDRNVSIGLIFTNSVFDKDLEAVTRNLWKEGIFTALWLQYCTIQGTRDLGEIKWSLAGFDQVSIRNNTFNNSVFNGIYLGEKNSLDIHDNNFGARKLFIRIREEGFEALRFNNNKVSERLVLSLPESTQNLQMDWKQLSSGVLEFGSYLKYIFDNNEKNSLKKLDSLLITPENFSNYLDSARIVNDEFYKSEIRLLGTMRSVYKRQHDLESANASYMALKDLETERLAYLYRVQPSFDRYFEWKVNQFLKVFSNYGTKPAKAITFSVYVIIFFAFIYLFFPNHWDSHGRKRIVDRYTFFFKYMDKKAGIHEVYLEDKKDELLEFQEFKDIIDSKTKKVPKIFTATALLLYRWAVSGTKLSASLLKRVDIMKGPWQDLPKHKRLWKSILLVGAFIVAIVYDLFIKLLNALMLSINTFTTLGFGEIPIKGLPRYLAIIQGFIGWFMLTIFSVSLISQLLN